jgi:hypothetical protein
MAEQEAISMLAAKVRQALSDDWEHGAEDETIRRLLEQALEIWAPRRERPKMQADVHEKSRSYRERLRHAGIKLAPKGRPLPGTFASRWKHRMDGGWERRPGEVGLTP